MLPNPVVETIGRFRVVRDDLLDGGTKRRAIQPLVQPGVEYVYPGPACGYAQLALAYSCREVGAMATIFLAKRKTLHRTSQKAISIGAKAVQVPYGYLATVQARAREYCQATGAVLLPFGADTPETINSIAMAALATGERPSEVWCVAGSGTLTRALQTAWPHAKHIAVAVGRPPRVGSAKMIVAPEKFDQDASDPPPFPSCPNYDAKAWQFMHRQAADGALFWNVGS